MGEALSQLWACSTSQHPRWNVMHMGQYLHCGCLTAAKWSKWAAHGSQGRILSKLVGEVAHMLICDWYTVPEGVGGSQLGSQYCWFSWMLATNIRCHSLTNSMFPTNSWCFKIQPANWSLCGLMGDCLAILSDTHTNTYTANVIVILHVICMSCLGYRMYTQQFSCHICARQANL